MFYKNLIKNNLKCKKYNFLPFNSQMNFKFNYQSQPLGRCSQVYNFDTSSEALKDGLGVTELKFVWNNAHDLQYKTLVAPTFAFVENAYFFRYWHKTWGYYYVLVIYCSNKKIYYNYVNQYNDQWHEITNLTLTEEPIALYSKVNGVDCLIFYNDEDGMFVWDIRGTDAYKVENPPAITSMCIHNERLFATVKGEARSIIFSEELNPINFNVSTEEGGYINMDDDHGKCNRVISFNGNLYVIRDYNIARVTEGKDRNEFIVEQLDLDNGKIFHNTVCVCGDKMMFLASDGIYEFNGTKSKKIDFDFDKQIHSIDNHYAIGHYSDGHYYLSCNMNFGDGVKYGCENLDLHFNNTLIKIDVNKYDCQFMRGVDVKRFVPINDGVNNSILVLYIIHDYRTIIGKLSDNVGNAFGENLKKCWRSEKYDFGLPGKYKYLRDIVLISHTDCDLNVYFDDRVKTIKIRGSEQPQTIKINEKSKCFAFEFLTENCGVYISVPQIRAGVYEKLS